MTIISLNYTYAAEFYPALPLEFRQNRLHEIESQVKRRWEKVREAKKGCFAPYGNKSDKEIAEEFHSLHDFRRHLWHRSPDEPPFISNPDYKVADSLLAIIETLPINNEAWPVRWIAFDYNHVGGPYNASTLLLFGHHFIALREPTSETVDTFFKVLMDHGVSILVRVKPEGEYKENGSFNYWEGKMLEGPGYQVIQPRMKSSRGCQEGAGINYFYTNSWVDDSGMSLEKLYELVQSVRKAYKKIDGNGPIACHCAAGVGRTGTFIAAYILAEMIDALDPKDIGTLSIEEVVLKLSIQRPKMVVKEVQYLLLYRFVDYYMSQKELKSSVVRLK